MCIVHGYHAAVWAGRLLKLPTNLCYSFFCFLLHSSIKLFILHKRLCFSDTISVVLALLLFLSIQYSSHLNDRIRSLHFELVIYRKQRQKFFPFDTTAFSTLFIQFCAQFQPQCPISTSTFTQPCMVHAMWLKNTFDSVCMQHANKYAHRK